MPKFLVGICIAPRRSLTVPASEEVVKELGTEEGDQAGRPEPERSLTRLVLCSRLAASSHRPTFLRSLIVPG